MDTLEEGRDKYRKAVALSGANGERNRLDLL